jgi:hypothetical protein
VGAGRIGKFAMDRPCCTSGFDPMLT